VFRNKVANYENWRETPTVSFFQFPLELRRRRLQEKKRRVGKETLRWLPPLSSSVILWKKARLAHHKQRRSFSFELQKHNQKKHPNSKIH
jgi:hypothetical protein